MGYGYAGLVQANYFFVALFWRGTAAPDQALKLARVLLREDTSPKFSA